MTRQISDLSEIANQFDAIILDQWGVLHDGRAPYDGAVDALRSLAQTGVRLAVLSNSGKRASLNAKRITDIGFPDELFETVMTSGEALWQDLSSSRLEVERFFAIERAPGDAKEFLDGLAIDLMDQIDDADAVLLMGLPDDADPREFDASLDRALDQEKPVICTNPDRASPRAYGQTVVSPGALAHKHMSDGGDVTFYGKPHLPVFRAVETALKRTPKRLLMVGDSLEHDIAGGAAAGWSTAFIRGGLHHDVFGGQEIETALAKLIQNENARPPDYTLQTLGGRHA